MAERRLRPAHRHRGPRVMPTAPLRPCAHPGCSAVVERGRCVKHDRRRLLDERRNSARSRGYDQRWQQARVMYLAHNPLCVHCEHSGLVSSATVVDHVVPHRGDRFAFWDVSNWQALCGPCHAVKTARESGLSACPHTLRAASGACSLCGGGPQNFGSGRLGTARGPSRVRMQVSDPPGGAQNGLWGPSHGS